MRQMVIGKKYRITYRCENQRYNRESVLVLLNASGTKTTWKPIRAFGEVPVILKHWIILAEEVPEDAIPYLGRRASKQ